MKHYPLAIKLTRNSVARNDSLYRHIASVPGRTGKQVSELVPLFDFKNDERSFAKQILETRRNYWIFRCNQQQFCGDFYLVDMSSWDVRSRPSFVVDLKQNAPLKTDGGGAGNQFSRSTELHEWISREFGIIDFGQSPGKISGDRSCILEYL